MDTKSLEAEIARLTASLEQMRQRLETDRRQFLQRIQEYGQLVTACLTSIEDIVGPLSEVPTLDLNTGPAR